MTIAYVDSSAIIKLIIREAESEALAAAMRTYDAHLTSDAAMVEVPRAVRRARVDGGRITTRVLGRFASVTLDRQVIELAAELEPSSLRSLDAIHIASAMSVEITDLVFIAYDRRCLDGARRANLSTSSPT